jgi:hypothetical protein
MSLPAGQQRILDGIAETFRLTEPRLAVMFAIFTRLTSGEPPPCREQLAVRRRVAWLPAPWQQLPAWRGEHPGLAWRRLLIIGQVAIAFIALFVLMCVTSHGAAGCGDVQRPHADAIYAPRQQACLAPGSSGFGLAGK